ncbi:Putative cysteine desulfurase NifS [Bacillus sp. THAF10]|uniref:IscS subfamily cysteine desulfurase n=1 Tax=Bacillus sp. THAF10 TaxID=2587848 RepID=UPI00126927BA|nr:IscS subfamily cysteine desulfurase [Bacillus sp. THAF10]QFT90035.1 Putative cysteine desulfurase NifS [Bacillus sp. THAF10]
MIYLDYAATTPMSKEALDVYQQVATTYYANSSSLHDSGSKSSQLLETCRSEFARMISGKKEGVYFTSGGSEANYLAIRSLLKGNNQKGKHIISTGVEHSSIHHLLEALKKDGYEISFLPLDQHGLISLTHLKKVIRKDTCLVSVHCINSETGIIQPLEAIGKILEQENILFHSDCVQAFGKIPIDVEKWKLTSLSVSSHKLYGPKGVGALYIAPEASWRPVYEGTTHEKGMRPGTVDIPGIAAFLTAAQQAEQTREERQQIYKALRSSFSKKLKELGLPIEIEGEQGKSLPQIIGLRIPGMEGQHVMLECNRKGIAISTGSACQVGTQSPSRTMLATGKTPNQAREFIRVSFGKDTTITDLEALVLAFKEILEDWMKRSG